MQVRLKLLFAKLSLFNQIYVRVPLQKNLLTLGDGAPEFRGTYVFGDPQAAFGPGKILVFCHMN